MDPEPAATPPCKPGGGDNQKPPAEGHFAMTVQAIETVYAGHLFRSRLEARWAVFFDTLRIKWRYEPQGYRIQMHDVVRNYLPDFHLPDLDIWVEVKGEDNRLDWSLLGVACDGYATAGLPASKLAYSGGPNPGSAILILGDIPPEGTRPWAHPIIVNEKGVRCSLVAFDHSANMHFQAFDDDIGYFDATCGGFEVPFTFFRGSHGDTPSVHGHSLARGGRNRDVADAYRRARMARFEHGATA